MHQEARRLSTAGETTEVACNRPDACGCAPTPTPLKVVDNFQGWGNRIGWWLTAAALGEALGRPAVFTGWHGAPRFNGGRSYDYNEVRHIVRLPTILRYLEDVVAANRSSSSSRGGSTAIAPPLSGAGFRTAFRALDAEEIPYHPKPYVNDYVPEPAWEMVQSWRRRRLLALPPCLTRTSFLRAFRRVGAELRASDDVERCLPARRSFIALHVRRGDKAAVYQKDLAFAALGRASALKRATSKSRAVSADLYNDNRTWAALARIARAEPSLPWMVISDGASTRNEATQRLQAECGARIVRPSCAARPWNASRPLANMTVAVLSDFFALTRAAAVVAIAPNSVNQGLAESSFATVAAIAADMPHLTPAPFSEAGKMAAYETKGNGGRPMRGIFFLDDLPRFVKALRDPRFRYRKAARDSLS